MNNNNNSLNYSGVRPGSPHGKKVGLAVLKTIVDGHAQTIEQMGRILSMMVKEGRLNTTIIPPNVETNSAVTPNAVTPNTVTPPRGNSFNTPHTNRNNTPPPSARAAKAKRRRLFT